MSYKERKPPDEAGGERDAMGSFGGQTQQHDKTDPREVSRHRHWSPRGPAAASVECSWRGRRSRSAGRTASQVAPRTAPRWQVQIVNPATGKPKTFSFHSSREAAERGAAKLRAVRMFAQVRRVDDETEHRGDRRRFLIAMCMLGTIPPERVTERIVAELDREAK